MKRYIFYRGNAVLPYSLLSYTVSDGEAVPYLPSGPSQRRVRNTFTRSVEHAGGEASLLAARSTGPTRTGLVTSAAESAKNGKADLSSLVRGGGPVKRCAF